MKIPSLRSRLRMALREDGAFRDVTSNQVSGLRRRPARAVLMAKANGTFCGVALIQSVFSQLDPRARFVLKTEDGDRVRKGQTLALISGSAYALLAGERTFLNLACRLSGIATLTRRFVDAVQGSGAAVLDTRKTTPLWRDLEKWAVRCGGGSNHRLGLDDAILVKDNHWALLRQVGQDPEQVYRNARMRVRSHIKFLEMEAKTLAEVWGAIRSRADIVLLDNMPTGLLKKAIFLVRASRRALASNAPLIEISGGVTLPKARRLARLGVDRISVGALTHSAPALDLSLEVN